jgi:outer membrane murein-binding lipoprotein Lpp
MPLGDFGLSQAFTVKTNASEAANNQIEDMKYAEQIRRQNEAMAMAKAKMFADDIEFQNGSNPYDSQIIKQENGDMLKKIGEISSKPEYMYDRNLQAQVNQLKNDYRQTKAVLRSAAWKEAQAKYNAFSQEALKNPTAYNLDQLDAFKKKMENYGKGADGNYLPTDQVEALVFTPPEQLPDYEKMHNEAAKMTDPDEYEAWNNGTLGAFKGKVSDATVRRIAEGLYEKNKSAYDYTYKDKPDKVGAIFNELRGKTKTDVHYGQVDDFWKQKKLMEFEHSLKNGVQNPNISLYDTSFLNTDRVEPGREILAEVYTTTPPNFYIDVKGNKVQNNSDDFHYNGDLTDQGYMNKKPRSGIKEATGYISKDLNWGKEQGYLYDPAGFSGDKEGLTDLEVRPEHKGKGEIAYSVDKDGKRTPYFKLYSNAVIDGRLPIYRSRVDKGMAPKLRAAAGVTPEMESGAMPQTVTQNGYTYTLNPQTGKYE